jgi:hypothetical protein
VLRVDSLESGDLFGDAVSFDGVRAVVGAVAYDALSFDADTWLGAAWVLRRSGSGSSAVWVEESRLVPAEPEEELRGDRYSSSVAIDGPWAAVGAPFGGAVYLFRSEGGTWPPTQKLVNTLPLLFSYGGAVVVRDGLLLTGCGCGAEESVAVWTYGSGGWTEQVTLQPSDGSLFTSSDFGWSIAYDGVHAAVGAPDLGIYGGAYVYGPSSLPIAAEPPASTPTAAVLSAPEPHPFNDRTTLTLHLDRPQAVEAALYDGLGRRVRLLHAGPLPAGEHLLNIAGADLAPGLYVLRVTGEDFALSQRLIHVH